MSSALDFQQITRFVSQSTVEFLIKRVYGRGIPENRNVNVSGIRVQSGGRYGMALAPKMQRGRP